MKKFLFILLVTLSFGVSMYATDSNDFNLDYNAVQSEFKDLNALSNMVTSNPNITYSTLQSTNPSLVTSMNLSPVANIPAKSSGSPVLGIPSFLWGCVLGLVGMAIVYIVSDQDMDETKKSLWGCLVGSVVGALFYILFWGALFSASTVG